MIDGLTLRDNARTELMKIKTVESGINYLNKLSTLEFWVKAEKKDAELQNIVAEQKLRTQRLLGQLIRAGQEKNEIAKRGENQKNLIVGDDKVKKKLSDIGITPDQSSTFQKIYSIPLETFEEAIAKNKLAVDNAVSELTTSGFLRIAKQFEKNEDGVDEGGERREDCFDKGKLISLRIKNKVSQYELSMQTGVETCTISRMEAGISKSPSFDTVARIARYFKEPMESFIMDGTFF